MADEQLGTQEDLDLQAAIAMSLGQDVSSGKRGADGELQEAGGGSSSSDESASKAARVGRSPGQPGNAEAGTSAAAAPAPAAAQPAASPPPSAPAQQPVAAATPPAASTAQAGGAGNVSDLASAFLELLQNSGGGLGGAAAGAAASAAPATAAAAAPAGGAAPQASPQYADFIQAIMNLPAGGGGAGGMPGMGPGALQQRAGRVAQRAPPRPHRAPVTPQWIKDFVAWKLPMHAPPDSAAIPADHTQATSTLKAMFGVDFHVAGEATSATQSVALTLSADGTVSRALAMHALKSALTRMRMNNAQSGQGPLESLAASFVRAQAAQKANSEVSSLVGFWMDMIACGVLEKLKADTKDDLYFAGGRDRLTFRNLIASGHVPQALLARCVDLSPSALGGSAAATEMWEEVLVGAFNDLRQFEFASAESDTKLNLLLAPLAAMTSHPPLLRVVAVVLMREVIEINSPTQGKGGSAGANGGLDSKSWERNSLMGPLLSITTCIDPKRALQACTGGAVQGPLPAALAEVAGYPRNRDAARVQLQAAQHSVQQAHTAAHAILKRIATAKTFQSPSFPPPDSVPPSEPPGVGREVCLAWLSAAMYACEPRTAGGEKAVLHREYINLGCSDGFALGVSTVALQFVTPVLNKFDSAPAEMISKIMPKATLAAMSRRVGNLLHARRLAAPAESADVATGDGDDEVEGEDASAINGSARVKSLRAIETELSDFKCAADVPGAAAATIEGAKMAACPASRFEPTTFPPKAPKPLESPGFPAECVYLAIRGLQVGLLPAMHRMNETMHSMGRHVSQAMAAAGPDAVDRRGMPRSDTPAGVLMDKTIIVEDCFKAGLLAEAAAVAATRMLGLVLAIVRNILEASNAEEAACVPEPMVRDVVNYAAFVITSGAPDLFAASKDLHTSMISLAMILRSKMITSAMTRSSIVDLMRAMLQGTRTRSRGAPLTPPPMSPGAAALTEAVFQTVSAAGVVPALMVAYSEADAVEGLDVDKYHFDKFGMRHTVDTVLRELWKDEKCLMDLMAMAAPDHPQRQVFLDFAKALLNDLSYQMEDSFDRIADVQNLSAVKADATRWAALPIHEKRTKESFLQSQISTAGGFMRMAMATVALILSLIQHAPIRALFLEPARAAHCAHLCMHLIQQLLVTRDGGADLTSCTEVKWQPNDVLASLAQVLTNLAVDPSFAKVAVEQTSFSEKALRGAVGRLQGLEREIQMAGAYADGLNDLLRACLALRAASVSSTTSAVNDALALVVPEPSPDVETEYVAAVAPHAYGTFDHTQQGAYMYDLAKRAKAAATGGARQRQKKLMRELRAMQAEGGLPVASGASVFVRSDEERLDIVRACITGPADTPYAYGMFFFDVLFPQDYPNIPPLMLLETTGGGRVRFNPNLYADGKVCLSLLGTWHGSEHEKWNPATSSLWQVLVSVQAMVFVSDPYFNEPNVEQMRNQTEGINASKSLNSVLSINTIQWAMIDVLKNPKPGFEDAIKAHFLALRPTTLRNCQAWLKDMDDSGEQGKLNRERMAGVILELNELLNALG